LYLAGSIYVAFSAFVVLMASQPSSPLVATHASVAVAPYEGPAGAWFSAVKPYCNALEAEIRLRAAPPPDTRDGAGYRAACLALAGKIDAARTTIRELPRGDRAYAAWIVFNVGHPVADAGDDLSAGPMMRLVVEFWPENHMAMYHAGMAEYGIGEEGLAEEHLQEFLEMYDVDDGFRRNALTVLQRLQRN
jgi:hypothetical protein